MSDLTPDEIAFFNTGELPESLAQEQPAESQVVAPPQNSPLILDNSSADTQQQAQVLDVANTQPVEDAFNPAELLRRSLLEEQNRRAQAEVRLQELQKHLEEKSKPVVAAPNPDTDPLGAMMHQLNQVNATVLDLQNKLSTEQQNNQLKQNFQSFVENVQSIKNSYEKVTPDFNAAYQYIRDIKAEDFRMSGLPQDQVNQALLQGEINLAQNALANGKNPADEMYKMAKRYGYNAAKQVAAAPSTPTQKIENLLKGQSKDKALSPATPAQGSITIDALKDASNADINKFVMDEKSWASLVGGKTRDIF